jgi:hypothetical protein
MVCDALPAPGPAAIAPGTSAQEGGTPDPLLPASEPLLPELASWPLPELEPLLPPDVPPEPPPSEDPVPVPPLLPDAPVPPASLADAPGPPVGEELHWGAVVPTASTTSHDATRSIRRCMRTPRRAAGGRKCPPLRRRWAERGVRSTTRSRRALRTAQEIAGRTINISMRSVLPPLRVEVDIAVPVGEVARVVKDHPSSGVVGALVGWAHRPSELRRRDLGLHGDRGGRGVGRGRRSAREREQDDWDEGEDRAAHDFSHPSGEVSLA